MIGRNSWLVCDASASCDECEVSMVKVYVASHINVPMPSLPYCVPLQTGSAAKEPWEGYLRDDVGDNISHKNRFFGEVTGLYWVWKNTTDEKVGWCHYRRFFSPMLFRPDQYKGVAVDLNLAQHILDLDREGKIFDFELNVTELILPTKIPAISTFHYCATHRPADWAAMLHAFEVIYPSEAEDVRKFFAQENHLHWWCMFISSRRILNEYCEWLFPLLFYLETIIVPADDDFHCRVFAFLTEHLFNWWTTSRGVQAVNRPIIFLDQAAFAAANGG